ncbi:MAG: PEP-CTERM sorting domain-containing protein [Armatimonadetes bacterium]|nr:PEP-CTERM sorting domain-containing protein [Armatimonadota bacterium]
MKLLVFAGLAVMATSAFSQNFVNPNFAGDASGWSVLDCDFGGYQNSAGQDGNIGWMWLNSNGTSTVPRIEQTVGGFTVGNSYTVSGWFHTLVIYNSGDPFLATLNGNVIFTGPDARVDNWTQFSYNFVATQSSNTFGFEAEVLKDSDFAVDSFNISPNAVPEPMTLAGLAGFALLARRRKATK